MPSLTLEINPSSDLHQKIITSVFERIQASKKAYQNRYDKWIEAEERTLAYLPERDVDAVRRGRREAGSPQYTTIQVPYSYGVLMASHTYWTTVFMSRSPVLQLAGRHGETEQQVQAFEALLDYQVQVGEMLVPWYIWLYDVGKYGAGIIGNFWEEEYSIISEIIEKQDTILGLPMGRTKKVKTSRRVPGYQGNKFYNVRPYDFFPDPRVTLTEFQKGEFVGVYKKLSWNAILKRKSLGYYVNTDALEPNAQRPDSERVQGSPQLELPDNNALIFDDGAPEGAKSSIPLLELYIELVPNEWGLGSSDYPEKWVFTVDAQLTTVIGVQPLGMNHNKFPFNALSLEPEGYSLAVRSMSEILEPVQNTMDWLINSHFYNVRKVLNGQFVVDPSRVMMSDLLDPLPGGIIRMKPAGYGTPTAEAVQQLSAVDVTQNHLRDMQVMQSIGERAIGVNDQLMGAMQPNGRKTATEIRTSSSFGINRLKTLAEFFSAQGWSPMTQMMVQNTQQFYDQQKKFKIVGDLAMSAGPGFMDVNAETIAGFYDFVPVDGTLPIDRYAQASLWQQLLMNMRNFPELTAQFDLGKIFSWVAQLAGLKNINQFRVQVVPDAQLQAQAQQGNAVPLGVPFGPQPVGTTPATKRGAINALATPPGPAIQ